MSEQQFKTLHVGAPNLGNREKLLERFNDILDRRWFTNNGKYVQEFEQRVADYLDVKHCIATCNGTAALELAVRALDMEGEVILPSFTFIATAHALSWQGIKPVFCDIAPGSHNIDPDQIEALITPNTTGIIGVHLWGIPCQIEKLTRIAKKHNLKLIFDAAHAFGNTYKNLHIGTFGDAEIFSFHATKFINSFEGGAITTNNDELAEKLRYMINFGFTDFDCVEHAGTNGKMTEICAAMGITSLESMDDFIAHNKRNYLLYKKLLDKIPGIKLIDYPPKGQMNYQYIVCEIDENTTGISRDDLILHLHQNNILARRYFHPGCHRMPFYSDSFRPALIRTEILAESIFTLPTGTAISEMNIKKICNIIRSETSNLKKHINPISIASS